MIKGWFWMAVGVTEVLVMTALMLLEAAIHSG